MAKRKRKRTSIVDALGTMTPEQLEQEKDKVFQGEMMTCIMCGCQQKSNPRIESQWRIVQVDGVNHYVCPDEFPPDGASKEAFSEAYKKILQKLFLIDNGGIFLCPRK